MSTEGIIGNGTLGILPGLTGSYPGKVEEINRGGYIFTPRKARKDFISCISHKLIVRGSQYYAVTIGGGGLGSLKRPDRILLSEIDQYIQKYNWSVK